MGGVQEQLDSASSHLDQARRQALETEQIGLDVLTDLRDQRETIKRTHANVGDLGANMAEAKAKIENLLRRARQNKIMTYAILAFLALVAAGTFYLMNGGPSREAKPSIPNSQR